jgi:hypothetical protein
MKSRASFAAGWKLMCLAVLLAIVVSSGVSQADKGVSWGIEVANVGDEPLASGVATLTNVRSMQYDYPPYPPPVVHVYAFAGQLSLTCENLTPGATYATPVGTFRADRTGTGNVKGKLHFGWTDLNYWLPFEVDIDRLDPDGSSTTVLVGYIWWY